jgi:S-(hydroxymethyl)glutathione dehydrogenase/alcohol dehydrogenase
MKTKGGLLWSTGSEWTIEEIELGEPVPGEVQVDLAASGLCHSDEHVRTGDLPMQFPFLGGHEGAGVVTKVGPGVNGLAEGDHVVLGFIPACGRCPSCSSGHQNLCDLGAYLMSPPAIADGTIRATARGQDIARMCQLGTFSPTVVVHESSVIKIENDIPLDRAALVGCGVTTGWGSSVYAANVQPGDTVVVVGVGGIGMNAVQGAALAGAKRVVAIDPEPFKREQAATFGATHTFASMAEAQQPLTDLTWGRLADRLVLTVGRVTGDLLAEAMALVTKNGTAVVTGMGNVFDMDVKLNLFDLTMMQKTLRGCIFGGGNPRYDIPKLLGLYREGKLKLDELVTTEYKLEELNQGYADMYAGKNIRGLVRYSDADR